MTQSNKPSTPTSTDTKIEEIFKELCHGYYLGTIADVVDTPDNPFHDTTETIIENTAAEFKKAKTALKTLLTSEKNKARIEEVERFLVEPGEVILYNNNTFADGFRYVVDKMQDRLTQLREME